MDRQAVHKDYERVRQTFRRLLDTASKADLAQPTDGTRWTNEQLLWHMLFGYMIVLRLLTLVRVFGRLPRSAGKVFAGLLDAAAVPFDLINYAGPVGAVKCYGPRRMGAAFDQVTASVERRLAAESEAALQRGHALPRPLGPVLQGLHDARRHLPLSEPALRLSPRPAHLDGES